jgi:hypothetical protein
MYISQIFIQDIFILEKSAGYMLNSVYLVNLPLLLVSILLLSDNSIQTVYCCICSIAWQTLYINKSNLIAAITGSTCLLFSPFFLFLFFFEDDSLS